MDRVRHSARRFAGLIASIGLVLVMAAAARADDFHVTNKVYFRPKDPKEKPSESTTLFFTGKVYDFLKTPRETIVFDPSHDQIFILDPDRRLKTQISTGEISTQINKLREAARQHKSELVRSSASPRFAEAVDPKTGALKLTSRWRKYEIETMAPDHPQVARQYAEFADWSAQLNALLNPPTLPFPRLALNEVLRQRQEIPTKITLTQMTDEKHHKEHVARSEHMIQMALSQTDKGLIEEAHNQLHTFSEVGFDEYHRLKLEQQASVPQETKSR